MNNSIIIFQARPLTTITQKNYKSLGNKILKIIEKNQNSYEFYSRNSNSVNTIFSDMADWNPSEIIGNNPNLLDYSLYDYIIMSKSWYLVRNLLNYQTINIINLL